ncbi:MAG: TIGR01777 family oxidoreductase [Anaerolineales bacterium]|jgi:uncharacterized protein (TIGR01777 family)
MRVIITGGSGLIGSHLAQKLLRERHEVIVLSRNPARHRGDVAEGVRLERWDAQTAEGWGVLAEGADAIVNLAGTNLSAGPWTASRRKSILESRLNAGQAVVQAVQQAQQKPGVVIQSSAVGHYGARGDEAITPHAEPGDDFLAKVTVQWEDSTAPVEEAGVRRAVIRSGLVLSKDGGALPLFALPFNFFVGGPWGTGNQYYSWIHIDDEVAAIQFLIENQAAQGAFNLTAPNPVTNRTFAHTFGKVLKRPSFLRLPRFAWKVLGEMSTVIIDGQRAVPARLMELGFNFRYPELEPALRAIFQR